MATTTTVQSMFNNLATVVDRACNTLCADFATKNVYKIIENISKDKDMPFNPYPESEWQNYANITSAVPKVNTNEKKKALKVETVKDESGKTVKKETKEVIDKDVRFKKITTFNVSGRNAMAFILATLVNEAKIAIPKIQEKKVVGVEEIKDVIIDNYDSSGCEWALSCLIFKINRNTNPLVIEEHIKGNHGTLEEQIRSKIGTHLDGISVLKNIIVGEFIMFLKIFSIHLATNMWYECKPAESPEETKAKEEALLAGIKKTKKTPAKKAKPVEDTADVKYVGTSKATSKKQILQFLHIHNQLCDKKYTVNMGEIAKCLRIFEQLYAKMEITKKAQNRTKISEKAKEKEEKKKQDEAAKAKDQMAKEPEKAGAKEPEKAGAKEPEKPAGNVELTAAPQIGRRRARV